MMYYTDGSSDFNYAAYAVVDETGKLIIGDRIAKGTSQLGEFNGVLAALRLATNDDCIYTDSQYLANTYNEWMLMWEKKDFKRPSSRPLAHLDKIKELIKLKHLKPNVKIIWIPRSSHEMNKLADKFAYEILKKGIDSVAETV